MSTTMGMSQKLQDEARREWRELGFFFNYDETAKRWSVTGSRRGLRRFTKILADYAANRKHEPLSEHEHYGPYMDLKLVTWNRPEIRRDGIYGRPVDFARLADEVERALQSGVVSVALGSAFVGGDADIGLEIRVAADDFDPALADAAITN